MNRHSRSTRALVEAALMIALATILGYFRLYRFPQGGSVDFAMVPILIYCLRWGQPGQDGAPQPAQLLPRGKAAEEHQRISHHIVQQHGLPG